MYNNNHHWNRRESVFDVLRMVVYVNANNDDEQIYRDLVVVVVVVAAVHHPMNWCNFQKWQRRMKRRN